MELLEYKESIIEAIKLEATIEMTSEKEEFLNLVTETLIEADEIDDFIFLPFEGLGKKGRKIQIDGYSYNELDNYLTIFTAPPLSYSSNDTLTKSDAEKIFARAQSFIEDATFIQKYAEESAPGYGLAVDIGNYYKDVEKYCIYIITDMVMSKSIKELKFGEVNNKLVEYNIWDITRLHKLAESETGKEDIVINLKDFNSNGIPFLAASRTDDYMAYLCNIPGRVLADLYITYGGRLLEGNVRSFLQTKGKVNKGIRNTILNNPSMFFAYNNGIAATAYDIKIQDIDGVQYITEITSLQIVNGGQTTASLAMALLSDKRDNSEEKINNIFVPMKLSIVSPEKSQELIPNISRYANSQNKVSDADLWSNHPFHIRIEEFSRRIIAPATNGRQYGTYWYYERANGQYKQETYKYTKSERQKFEMSNPKNQMFKKTDLAKFINIFNMRPNIASAGGQKSFSKFAEGLVTQWEKDNSNYNEEFYRDLVSKAIIFKQSDRIVKRQPWYNSYKANIVAYTISSILYCVKTEHPSKFISYKSIWQKQDLSTAWIKQIEIVSEKMYNHLIDDNRTIENVTEWAKRETCWERAKTIKIKLVPEFIKELTSYDVVKEIKRDARKEQKETNKINAMVEVVEFGVENWKDLLSWDAERSILSPYEKDFIKRAIEMEKGKVPSEKQCIKILEVLEKARDESYPK